MDNINDKQGRTRDIQRDSRTLDVINQHIALLANTTPESQGRLYYYDPTKPAGKNWNYVTVAQLAAAMGPIDFTEEDPFYFAGKDASQNLNGDLADDEHWPTQLAVKTYADTKQVKAITVNAGTALTLAQGDDLIVGTTYTITGAGVNSGEVCTVTVKAVAVNQFSGYGYGTYLNDVMSTAVEAIIGYDVNNNAVYMVHELMRANHITYYCHTFPFDDANIVRNNLVNCGLNFACRATRFVGNTAKDTSIVFLGDRDVNMSNCNFTGAIIGAVASPAFIYTTIDAFEFGAYIHACTAEGDSQLVADQSVFIQCHIGAAMVVDTTTINSTPGYVAQQAVIDSRRSTFVVTPSYSSVINPDGGGNIDLSEVPWGGIVILTDVSAPGGAIISISGTGGSARIIRFHNANGLSSTADFTANAGNFKLNAATRILADGGYDFIELSPNSGFYLEEKCLIAV